MVLSGPIEKILEALSQCGKRIEYATRKAEAMADNVWQHRESSLLLFAFVSLTPAITCGGVYGR